MEFSRCSQSANSIDVHQEMGSQLMICGQVYCVNKNSFISSTAINQYINKISSMFSSTCNVLIALSAKDAFAIYK